MLIQYPPLKFFVTTVSQIYPPALSMVLLSCMFRQVQLYLFSAPLIFQIFLDHFSGCSQVIFLPNICLENIFEFICHPQNMNLLDYLLGQVQPHLHSISRFFLDFINHFSTTKEERLLIRRIFLFISPFGFFISAFGQLIY